MGDVWKDRHGYNGSIKIVKRQLYVSIRKAKVIEETDTSEMT